MKRFLTLGLIFILTSTAWAALTPDQTKIVNEFRKFYFIEENEGDIDMAVFMDKTNVQKQDFIRDWAIKQRVILIARRDRLNQLLNQVQNKISIVDQALLDWGITP